MKFKEAASAGIKAHRDVARAFEEIKQVLNDLFEQAKSDTTGAVTVELRTQARMETNPPEITMEYPAAYTLRAAKAMGMTAKATMRDSVRKEYKAIVASRQVETGTLIEELCEIEFSKEGYPVVLRFGDRREDCYDKASLDAGLEAMLSHHAVGARLSRLLAGIDLSADEDEAEPEEAPGADEAGAGQDGDE